MPQVWASQWKGVHCCSWAGPTHKHTRPGQGLNNQGVCLCPGQIPVGAALKSWEKTGQRGVRSLHSSLSPGNLVSSPQWFCALSCPVAEPHSSWCTAGLDKGRGVFKASAGLVGDYSCPFPCVWWQYPDHHKTWLCGLGLFPYPPSTAVSKVGSGAGLGFLAALKD